MMIPKQMFLFAAMQMQDDDNDATNRLGTKCSYHSTRNLCFNRSARRCPKYESSNNQEIFAERGDS